MKRRNRRKREESERRRDFERGEEFKGLREQMANCTRVSQPGSKSVLCIRTGVGGRAVGDRRGLWRELGSVIRP